MAYEAKTNWLPDDEIREDDLNRWEQGIDDAHSELDGHKNDLSNPHRVTKKQVGLGNVDDVQQAPKKEFDNHRDNVNNPHKVNSTQINVISAKSATAKYNEYPKGITIAETGTGTSMGYPWDLVLIETEQLGVNRTVQTIYDVSSATVTRSMVRKYREADGGWGEWAKTETEVAAQEKADKAESNAKNASVPRTGGTMSGDLILNNDKKISHKSPNGEVRRTIHRGGDDNVYINTDNIGKTIIRGARVVNKEDKDFETTDGSQSKANQAETNAKNHAESVATSKANTAESNAKNAANTALNSHKNDKGNPHGVTSEQVNVIERYTKKHDDEAKTYPMGHSVTFVRAEDGWFQYGTVETWRGYSSGGGTLQIYTPYAPHMGGKDLIFRIANYTDGDGVWGEWRRFETQDGAQNRADKAETNAKNASVPRSGGEMGGTLRLPKLEISTTSNSVKQAINANGNVMYFGNPQIEYWLESAAQPIWNNGTNRYTLETITGAQSKANQAETNAKSYAGSAANQVETNAKNHATNAASTAENNAKKYADDVAAAKANAAETNAKNAATSALNGHTGNKSNPHGVTKAQVGLGSVDNVQQATKSEFNSHVNNKSNPHGVTSRQVNETAERAANVAGTDYPLGVSYFSTANGTALGYPGNLGTAHTVNDSGYRIFQQFMESNSGANRFHYRNFRTGEGWSSWSESETTVGAQSKANAAETNAKNYAKAMPNNPEVPWRDVTWRNGKGGTLRYTVLENVLYLQGGWRNDGTTGTIASVPYLPEQFFRFPAATTGSYGMARVSLNLDGTINVEGIYANNPENVSWVDISISSAIYTRG